MEMNLKKNMYTHTHIHESLHCTPETHTTLEINYTSIKKKQINGWITGVLT